MINYLMVSLGAALGGGFRYWVSNIAHKLFPATFPYGTLTVNIIGSFILGLTMFLLDEREMITPGLRLFLAVGFCGGFTTFSSFSFETFNLFRDSQIFLGFVNILVNVTVCFIGVYLAYLISKI